LHNTHQYAEVQITTKQKRPGDGLTTAQMQRIANWTNLSETTFVLTPSDAKADYRVRIFTPNAELPFAGHPTLGTAHALLEAGVIHDREGVVIQECEAGLIKLTVTVDSEGVQSIAFDLPEPKLSQLTVSQQDELEAILGCPLKSDSKPLVIDVGARWLVSQLPSAKDVLAAKPDLQRMKIQDSANGYTGVVIFGEYEADSIAALEVRAFAPAHGVNEDPVCGSGNGAVAAYIRATGQAEHFSKNLLASQGTVIGRAGFLQLSISDSVIQVGGNSVTCIQGTLTV